MKNNKDKIISRLDQIAPLVKKIRDQKQKIVLTQGSFDMIHIGHARYLAEAKKYADVLIVGTDSDNKIKKRKGPGRPVVPEEERLEMLTYLKAVDYVVLKHTGDPKWGLIKSVRPDTLIIIKENYDDEQINQLQKYCGQIVVLPRMATTSTSAKLREVQLKAANQIKETISAKLLHTLEDAIKELKGE